MKKFKSLLILDKLKGIFNGFGIDYPTLRFILEFKLTLLSRMDDERGIKKIWVFLGNGFLMLITGLIIISPLNIFIRLLLIWTFVTIVVSVGVITNFDLLFSNGREKEFLYSRPIPINVINLARIVQAVIYFGEYILIMITPVAVVGGIRYGISFALLAFLSSFLLIILLIFVILICL